MLRIGREGLSRVNEISFLPALLIQSPATVTACSVDEGETGIVGTWQARLFAEMGDVVADDLQRVGFAFCPWRQTSGLVKGGMLSREADDHRSGVWTL